MGNYDMHHHPWPVVTEDKHCFKFRRLPRHLAGYDFGLLSISRTSTISAQFSFLGTSRVPEFVRISFLQQP